MQGRIESKLSGSGLTKTLLASDRVKPNIVLLALIVLIPLQNIYIGRVPSIGGGLNLLNVMLLVAFLGWRLRSDLSIPTKSVLNGPLIAYMVVFAISLITRLGTMDTMDAMTVAALKDLLIPPVLFFIVLNSVRDRQGIIFAIAATLIPLPYMFRVFRAQLSNVSSWHYDDDMRLVNGTFMNLGSNEIAAFYVAYVFIVLALIYFIERPKIRIALSLITLTSLYCILYSYSRGAYLSFLLTLTVFVFFIQRKLVILGIPLVLLFSATFTSYLPVAVQERFGTIVVEEEERDTSAESRFVLWGYALEQFYKNPLLGQGYMTFPHLNPLKKDTHNFYMKLLAEQGIFGFGIFIVILWRASKVSRSLYATTSDPLFKALGLGTFACVVSLAVSNIFGDRFTHYPLSSYFHVYLALCIRARYLGEGQLSLPETKRKILLHR